jgi:hypothetical protein
MNRRNAIKNLTLSLGYAVATPTILSVLSSCTENVATWKSVFFSEEQQHIVTNLAAIILPSSTIPGALDVNVPQFIDKMYKNIELEANQNKFKKGATVFASRFKEMFGKKVLKGAKSEIKKLFTSYFDLSEDEIQQVLKQQSFEEKEVSENNLDTYFMYKFLFSVRYYTLFGYYTSKKVGTEVLSYDPVPGSYKGCVPLEDIGKVSSL